MEESQFLKSLDIEYLQDRLPQFASVLHGMACSVTFVRDMAATKAKAEVAFRQRELAEHWNAPKAGEAESETRRGASERPGGERPWLSAACEYIWEMTQGYLQAIQCKPDTLETLARSVIDTYSEQVHQEKLKHYEWSLLDYEQSKWKFREFARRHLDLRLRAECLKHWQNRRVDIEKLNSRGPTKDSGAASNLDQRLEPPGIAIRSVVASSEKELRTDIEGLFAGATLPSMFAIIGVFRIYAQRSLDSHAEPALSSCETLPQFESSLERHARSLIKKITGKCQLSANIDASAPMLPYAFDLYQEIVGNAIDFRISALGVTEYVRFDGFLGTEHPRDYYLTRNIHDQLDSFLRDRIHEWTAEFQGYGVARKRPAAPSDSGQLDRTEQRVYPVSTSGTPAIANGSGDVCVREIDGDGKSIGVKENVSPAMTIENLLEGIDKFALPFPREMFVATLESKLGRHIGELRCSIPISELPPVGRLSPPSWRRVEETLFVLAEDLLSAVFGNLSLHNAAVYEETACFVASKMQRLILRIWGRFVGEDADESDYFCFLQEIEITIHRILYRHLAQAWQKHEKSHRETAEQIAASVSDTNVKSANHVGGRWGNHQRNEPHPPSNGNRKYKPSEIGRNIDRLREECGWTFDVLAEKTSLEKTSVIDHVRKGIKPRLPNLKTYADVFSNALSRAITVSDLQS